MQPTVLIIADQSDIAKEIVARWQMERVVPDFTVMSGEVWRQPRPSCHLAILANLSGDRMWKLVKQFEDAHIACICVPAETSAMQKLRSDHEGVLAVRPEENWRDVLVSLGSEVLKRVEASLRASKAEHAAHSTERYVALGKFMLESRHSFNNALTSVLGNSELLMLDPDGIPESMKEQIDTIHNMALKLHEMMQRFSSLDKELNVAEGESHVETKVRSRAYGSGT